ncbi:MAG: hypothetical protein CMA72_08665 [Euryarchaeota archaeon]|nr:hypothetical protein [Euryarchaeota archaeon]
MLKENMPVWVLNSKLADMQQRSFLKLLQHLTISTMSLPILTLQTNGVLERFWTFQARRLQFVGTTLAKK